MTKQVRKMARIMTMAVILLFVGTAFGQFNASLSGTVKDSTGGLVPNATVVLTNPDTHVSVTHTSSSSGVFEFPSIGGGHYDVTVTAPGFKPATYHGVNVAEGAPANLDVALSLGSNTESVNVDASDIATLQTQDASINTTIDSAQFEKVPAFGRDPYNMVRTAPGITGDASRSSSGAANFLPNSVGPGGSNFGVAATENTVQVVAAGQRITDNNYLVDGVSVNSLGYGGATVINPNIEAIGSMQITSMSFSAEDGRNSGAQVKIVTKSGTNQVHGSAFFQYDEPGLNAYNKYGGIPSSGAKPVRVSTKSRDYAASLGGPIIKDKLFGFASFEGTSQVLISFPNAYVETPQYRASIHTLRPGSIADQVVNAPGGVPSIRQVLNQSCTSPVNLNNGAATNPSTATQYPGQAPPLCAVVAGGLDIGSPVPETVLNKNYASFNATSADGYNANQIQIGNYLDGIPDIEYVQLNASQTSVARQYNGRLDYYVTPKDLIAGSAYVTKLYRTTPSDTARPNQALPFDPTNLATTLIYIHTFTPTLLNEFRANYTLFSENGVYDAQQAGINFGLPYIEIQNSNFTSNNRPHFGAVAASTSPGIFAENQYELRDTVTKVWGSHSIKAGFEARLEQDNNNLVGGSRPTYTFAGLWNFFNDAPIYEGISANPATGGQANASRHLTDHYYSAFLQHDWKVTPSLTFNAGLRYEYFEPIYNKGFDINYPVLGKTPGREVVDSGLYPRHFLWNPNYDNFSPKVGFAWVLPYTNSKSVLRGGFARAYNRMDNVLFDPALEDGPGIFSYGICCGTAPQDFGSPLVGGQIQYQVGSSTSYNSFAPNPALKTAIGANGLPTSGIQVEAYGALPNLPQPYSYLYSMEWQNDFGHQLLITVGYQGSTGRHYSRLVNQDFVSPNSVTTGGVTTNTPFYALYLAHNDSNISYNGLNVHASKAYKSGVSLNATYTWSKAIDQVSSGDGADGSANQTFPQDNRTERGPSDFDVRHRLVALGTYDLHPYHGGNEWIKAAANGWEVNGIFTAHTGFPWTPVTYSISGLQTVANTATIGPVRPTSFSGTNNAGCDPSVFRNGTQIRGTFGYGYVNGTGAEVNADGSPTTGFRPGIGRNSFRGPCYEQFDAGIAKEIKLKFLGEGGALRMQVQAFNVFNKLNFSPYTFSSAATQIDSGAVITGCPAGSAATAVCAKTATIVPGQGAFQRPVSADAGRVVELNARIRF